MNKTTIFLLLTFSTLTAAAQSAEESQSLHHLFKIELGFQGLGLAYELPLSGRWSLDLSTGLGGGYHVGNSYRGHSFQYQWIINDPVMYLKSKVKYNYNRPKRLGRGKPLRNNASNYVAFQTKYTTERVFNRRVADQFTDPLNSTLLNEVHWGIQRPLGQRFLFNMHLGLGIAVDYDFNNSSVYPGFGLKFSHILMKR